MRRRIERGAAIAVAVAFATCAVTTEVGADDDADATLDRWAAVVVRGPAVGEVLAAAYAAAGLDGRPAHGLLRRARLAGMVPWLSVRVGRDVSWQSDDPTVDRGMVFDVRATWRLDRLVFDGREIQIASFEAARRRERRGVGRVAIRAYFAWRRAAVRAADPIATTDDALAADEAAADLDALTDGWFSDALRRSRRTASETRTPPR